MGSFDVDAKISDVHDLELAIRRFDESSREIVEAASRSLKDIIAKINDELDLRQSQLAAAERRTAIAAASLARCEENCGPLAAALAEAQAAEQRERQRVDAAKKALTLVEAGASGFVGQQRTFSNDLITHLPVAISATTAYAVELSSFLAINTSDSVGSPARTGGGDSGSESSDESSAGDGAGPGGSPARAAVDGSSSAGSLGGRILSVAVSSVRDSDPVQSRSQFERVSSEQVEWGIDRLKSVVEPAVGMGKGLEYFEARDRAEGLHGERSNAGVFRWFYGENTAIKVRTGSDGTGELINGRHRLFVARRMGIDSLPMDVR